MIVPSKFYGVAAVGNPIVVIGDRNGELGRLVREHVCGTVITPGDSGALVSVLQRMSHESESVAKMGTAARIMLDANFTPRQGLARWQTYSTGWVIVMKQAIYGYGMLGFL